MSKIDVDKILTKAKIKKVADREDIDLYRVDLMPAGYNAMVDIEASSEKDALAKAKENLEFRVETDSFFQLIPKGEKSKK